MTSLLTIGPGVSVRIVDIAGGEAVRRRLFSLGLHIGDRIELTRRGILRGPVLIRHESTGVTLAIGRRIAHKIMVQA
jgi:Fe2+ transport system protein FeoA